MGFRERARGVAAVVLGLAGCGGAPSEPPSIKRTAAPGVERILVAPVPLRRLTIEEYNNTVRDLLGDTTRPASAFPPDEAFGGFESNNVAPVTPLLVERYMEAAETLAAASKDRIDTLAPCASGKQKDACARDFIDTFGRLAFRRPLEEEERAALLAVYTDKEQRSGYAGGIQLVIQALLQSPQFLYRVEPADIPGPKTRPLSGYEVATRLSFFVWASTPDRALLDDGGSGRLDSPQGIETVARRLLADPRAVDGIKSFHRQWLGLRELETASRDSLLTPSFTQELRESMVEETLRFSAHAVLAGGDTVTTLLTSNKSFVNAPLARLYGVAPPEGNEFAQVALPPEQRAGLLTQASVMTVLASAEQTSPVLRGKFVRERLLCHPIQPPPANVAAAPPKVDPKKTTRERFLQHRTDPTCAACHELIDPIGFGFEHYDTVGGWRTKDGTFPVDAVGEIYGTDDADGKFDGAVELAKRLAESEQVRRCVATQWFRYALGRSERDDDDASVEQAYRTFARSGFDVRELVIAITMTPAFRHARFEEGTTP